MPRYGYHCDKCGADFDVERQVAKYRRNEKCPVCGSAGERTFDVPYIMPGIKPYYDRGAGRVIKSRQDRNVMMKEQGVEPADEALTRKAEEILGEQYDKENRRPPKNH